MASLPTAQECRDHLEGYCVSPTAIGDAWITDTINGEVVPYVETYARTSLNGVQTITEYYSGNGGSEIMLNRRNPLALVSVSLVSGVDVTAVINIASIDLITTEGKLKIKSGLSEYWMWRIFPKGQDNIKITYTYGMANNALPSDLAMAVKKLVCIRMLDLLEGRTGGGDLGVQAFSRTFGNMGRYTHIRKRLHQSAQYTLMKYSTSVVGA